MSKTVTLEVITPSKMFYKGEIELVTVKTAMGEEGFMAGHSWAVKLLGVGSMRIREADGNSRTAFVSGGFIDVKENITIYADAAEWSENIDVDRAKQVKAEAEQYIADNRAKDAKDPTRLPEDGPDIEYARLQIEKSVQRIKIHERAPE